MKKSLYFLTLLSLFACFSYPVPTVAELRLQVYSNLAYGAQGIQYYKYWTPKPKDPIWKNSPVVGPGPITFDNKRSDVYDRIKLLNNEINNLSWVFLGAKVVSVGHTGDVIPLGTTRFTKLPQPIMGLNTKGLGAVVSELKKEQILFL